MESHIPPHIDKLYAEKQSNNFSCDVVSSSVQVINAPIPAKLYRELQAMSAAVNMDATCLAGELLTIAIEEAISSLPDEELNQLESLKLASQHEANSRRMEAQIYDAGAT